MTKKKRQQQREKALIQLLMLLAPEIKAELLKDKKRSKEERKCQ